MSKIKNETSSILEKTFGLDMEKDFPFLEELAVEIFSGTRDKIFECDESQIVFIASLVGGLRNRGITDPGEIRKLVKESCV